MRKYLVITAGSPSALEEVLNTNLESGYELFHLHSAPTSDGGQFFTAVLQATSRGRAAWKATFNPVPPR